MWTVQKVARVKKEPAARPIRALSLGQPSVAACGGAAGLVCPDEHEESEEKEEEDQEQEDQEEAREARPEAGPRHTDHGGTRAALAQSRARLTVARDTTDSPKYEPPARGLAERFMSLRHNTRSLGKQAGRNDTGRPRSTGLDRKACHAPP